jgi:hypothetical protein
MNLDIQLLNHNYIQRILIFAVFLYKRYKGQPEIYNYHIQGFLDKKLLFKVDYTILIPFLSLEDRRDLALESLLDGEVHPYIIKIHFKTGYQHSTINIDLNKEEEYEKYLRL